VFPCYHCIVDRYDSADLLATSEHRRTARGYESSELRQPAYTRAIKRPGQRENMQQSTASHKRAATRASPAAIEQQQIPQQLAYQSQQQPEISDFNPYDYSHPYSAEQPFQDASAIALDGNNFSYLHNTSQLPTYGSDLVPATSTDLVRRARNQQLATQNGQQPEHWNGGYSGMNGQAYEEDEQELAVRVSSAKKDAQGKKKSIPPFVQKLSRWANIVEVKHEARY